MTALTDAAKRAGIPTIAVRTGGYSTAELEEGGAVCVFDSIVELTAALDETPLKAG